MRWTFARLTFKRFIEVGEIIESRFKTDIGYAEWSLRQEFTGVDDSVFCNKLYKRFTCFIFKIATKGLWRHADLIGHLG